MFERWTERARHVIVLSQDAARTLKHNFIGTEHLLVGLCAEEEGLGARVLESFDLDAKAATEAVVKINGEGEASVTGQIPFTPRSKKVCELALREALSMGHNYIGTEHVLLALVRENEGVGARILHERHIDSEKVRNEVMRLLNGTPRRQPAPTMEDLLRPGDLMQSALSRLAEWVKSQDAPYEVHMAALEASDGIAGWTDVRRRVR